MKCKSKYSKGQVYNCQIVERDKVKIYKDDFQVLVSKSMFDKLFEIIEEDE